MAKLFRKKKQEQQQPTLEQAVDNSANTLNLLEKKINYYEQLSNEQLQNAKIYKKQGKLNLAKQCLKKRKMYEMYIEKMNGMANNLEVQQAQISQAEMTSKVFQAYVSNDQVLKQMFNGMSYDEVQDQIDDIMDTQQEMQEITDAIAGLQIGPTVDEDEIEDEFNQLDNYYGESNSQASNANYNNDDEDIGNLLSPYCS